MVYQKKKGGSFFYTEEWKIMGWSLHIAAKWFHVQKVQGFISIQITCLLYGWDIITNNFYIYFSLVFSVFGELHLYFMTLDSHLQKSWILSWQKYDDVEK
jgi:hypothetical protein